MRIATLDPPGNSDSGSRDKVPHGRHPCIRLVSAQVELLNRSRLTDVQNGFVPILLVLGGHIVILTVMRQSCPIILGEEIIMDGSTVSTIANACRPSRAMHLFKALRLLGACSEHLAGHSI